MGNGFQLPPSCGRRQPVTCVDRRWWLCFHHTDSRDSGQSARQHVESPATNVASLVYLLTAQGGEAYIPRRLRRTLTSAQSDGRTESDGLSASGESMQAQRSALANGGTHDSRSRRGAAVGQTETGEPTAEAKAAEARGAAAGTVAAEGRGVAWREAADRRLKIVGPDDRVVGVGLWKVLGRVEVPADERQSRALCRPVAARGCNQGAILWITAQYNVSSWGVPPYSSITAAPTGRIKHAVRNRPQCAPCSNLVVLLCRTACAVQEIREAVGLYSAVLYSTFQTPNGTFRCSATMVGPAVAATAGACVFACISVCVGAVTPNGTFRCSATMVGPAVAATAGACVLVCISVCVGAVTPNGTFSCSATMVGPAVAATAGACVLACVFVLLSTCGALCRVRWQRFAPAGRNTIATRCVGTSLRSMTRALARCWWSLVLTVTVAWHD